ncbi:hypothetical protein C5167_040843 [Papaver somniferum]|uniref:Uncharacterized protein n=1 Tax=Papaver somniferum TaxID=3469 RepID=A0A4Y7IJJ6_PAPSO|nr:uncharacterized protein LOC113273049 [Papaver somniferum]RZC47910.1 hypothetical protein C5167_040843 [Papaver somniferum]
MGRRPGLTKKNQAGAEGNNDDALLKDQSVNENLSSIAKDGTPEATIELTEVAIAEDGSLKGKSTRRSKRLLKERAPTGDFGIQSEVGTVEAEQDFPQSPEVEKKESDEVERLFKLVEQQQMRIDELAAEKSFSLDDLISVAEIGLKAKANKYKNMCADAERKIQGLQKKKHELTRKLECANAKLEGYEMGQQCMFEVIEMFRDASHFAGLTKTTETIAELPSTGDGANTLKRSAPTKKPQAAKRKKVGDISNPSPETKSQAPKKKRAVTVKGDGSSLAGTQK